MNQLIMFVIWMRHEINFNHNAFMVMENYGTGK